MDRTAFLKTMIQVLKYDLSYKGISNREQLLSIIRSSKNKLRYPQCICEAFVSILGNSRNQTSCSIIGLSSGAQGRFEISCRVCL